MAGLPGAASAQLCLDYSNYLHWVAGTDVPGSNPNPTEAHHGAPEVVVVDHPYVAGKRVAFLGVGQGDGTFMGWVSAIDVTDPTALDKPVADDDLLGTVSFGRRFTDLALDPQFTSGRPYIYCTSTTLDLVVIRVDAGVGDALNLVITHQISRNPGTLGSGHAMALGAQLKNDSTFVFLFRTGSAVADGGLTVYNLTNPASPTFVRSINVNEGTGGELLIHPNGNVLYLTKHFGGNVVNITNPNLPSLVVGLNSPQSNDLEISDDRRYLYVSGGRSDSPTDPSFRPLWVLDIANPLAPVRIGEGTFENGFEGGGGDMALRGNLLYQTYADGLRVIDVSDPTTPRVIGSAEATAKSTVSQLGMSWGVCLEGDHALVSSGAKGLQVLDITNGASPAPLAHVTGISPVAVEASGGLAVALSGSTLHVLDVSVPSGATLVGAGALLAASREVAMVGDTAYVSTLAGIEVWSLATPSAPVRLGSQLHGVGGASDPRDIEVYDAGGRRYVYVGNAGTQNPGVLHIFDATNPAAIVRVRNLSTGHGFIRDLDADCGRLYVATSSGLYVRSLANAGNPPLLGSRTGFSLFGLYVDGSTAYGVGQADPGFVTYDVSNPAAITQIGSFPMIESGDNVTNQNGDVMVMGDHAYVAWGAGGLFVLDVSDPTNPVSKGSSNGIYNYDDNFGLGSDVQTERDVFVAGGVVYNADGNHGLWLHPTQCGADGQPPVPEPHHIELTVPPATIVTADANTCGAVITNEMLGVASATEACPGDVVTITRTGVPEGNFFPADTTLITYLATDIKGRFVEAGQLVIVLDATPPSLTAPAAVSLPASDGACSRALADVALGAPAASDACGVTLSDDAPESFPVGETTVTWTATDPSGNTTTATQIVTILDTQPPLIAAPANLDLVAGPGDGACLVALDAEAIGTAIVSDNCSAVTVAASGIPEGSVFPTGTTMVTWTATDSSGNTATATQTVTVRCPYGDLAGTALLVCDPSSSPAEGVVVRLLHEGSPIRETTTGAGGAFLFEDVRLGTYTVAVTPPDGYGIDIDTRVVTLVEDGATLSLDPFTFTCLLRDLAGSVTGSCNGSATGLFGVTVDLYRADGSGTDVLVGTVATASDGSFRFDDLALGEYSVHVVMPLGYTGTAIVPVTLEAGAEPVTLAPVGLSCLTVASEPRTIGYWKHQVNVYLTGKGSAQESLDALLGYIDGMVEHFNENLVNPVIVYVPSSATTTDKLLQLQQLLTVNRSGTMLDRAKQQLLALLLNVVSGKLAQTAAISEDGATVSQAITYAHDLIVNGEPADDERAKDIADVINNGRVVPAGWIPLSTRIVTYSLQPRPTPAPAPELSFGLSRIAPNPARGAFTVSFSLDAAAAGDLEIVDLAGRRIVRHEIGGFGAGDHSFRVGNDRRLAAGMYFVRLRHAGRTLTRSVMVSP